MSDYIYREITKRDIDQLYASRDAEKWLIPYYQGPKTYYDVGKESIAEPIASEEWKLFRFSENFERYDTAAWFMYLEKDGSLLIMQDRWPLENDKHPMYPNREQEFVILFYSKSHENTIQKICELVVDIATQGSVYLTGKPEPDYWVDPIVTYRMAEPNDTGRDL